MSKTGGGRGTNQYQIRGIGKTPLSRGGSHSSPEVSLTSKSDLQDLLDRFPTVPGDYQAVAEPDWQDLSESVAGIKTKGIDRAVGRFTSRVPSSIYSDSQLEGFGYTQPEITSLLEGRHVPGHTLGEQQQVQDMRQATGYLIARVQEGVPLEPSQELSDNLHLFIAQNLGLRSLAFRGDQSEQYEGPRVSLGRGESFRALDARVTHAVLERGLERISSIAHPVLRGATWAAFSTYHQFYLDGNKRTGRYAMNAVLMSHGFDAIIIRASQKAQYYDALVEAYRTGDLTPHIRFLIEQYSDL